jgi:hypothetical protein
VPDAPFSFPLVLDFSSGADSRALRLDQLWFTALGGGR